MPFGTGSFAVEGIWPGQLIGRLSTDDRRRTIRTQAEDLAIELVGLEEGSFPVLLTADREVHMLNPDDGGHEEEQE
jgi:hypothetical protein